MGVVAVVAGGVGARLVFPVWPGVDGMHVLVDLLHHHPESRVLLGLTLFLRGLPEVFVALHATDPVGHARLVRNLGDVLVALDAEPLPVHALAELVRRDMQLPHFSIGSRHFKAFVSMAAQAGQIARVLFDLLRFCFCGCGKRLRGQESRCPCQKNDADQRPECKSSNTHEPRFPFLIIGITVLS